MESIIRQYNALCRKIEQYMEAEKTLAAQMEQLQADAMTRIRAEEVSLTQKRKEMQAELKDISRFRDAASRYASIDGYVPRPEWYNKNVLLSLYTMLGTSRGQKCAPELLQKCANAMQFVEEQERYIDQQTSDLRNQLLSDNEILRCRAELENARSERKMLTCGDQLRTLAETIAQYFDRFFVENGTIYEISIPDKTSDEMCLGFIHLPYLTDQDQVHEVRQILGDYYLPEEQMIRIPYSFSAERIGTAGMYSAPSIQVTYNDRTRDMIHKLVQGMIFNILRNYTPLSGRITYVDFETFNCEYLGSMKAFTGDENLIRFPTNQSQAKAVISTLEDVAGNEPENNRHRRYLIVRGSISNGSGGQFRETLQRISNNSDKNNIVVIFIDRQTDDRRSQSVNAKLQIFSQEDRFVVTQRDADHCFEWFEAPGGLATGTMKAFGNRFASRKVGNEYELFFPLDAPTMYVRDRRAVSLPFGVDTHGELQYLTFEGMEFASFVMGASGSGKSTLLHAIIAGIIQNYHPDEVELWLADLKLMEFANYTHHMPPHVKYILMDSSKEMVRDFIDLLHGEMERRQALLAAYGTNDCKNLPSDKYLPVLFVIVDEFSTLSDVIRDDDTYKRKLEQILVRGRGPGLRLIFASQSYTDGAPGLTNLAKKQIQTRIALRNTSDEIKQTLDIPSGQYTDAIRNDVDTLPAHYALRRVQEKNGTYRVDKVHGLYFNGTDEDAWRSRYALIDRLNKQMQPVPAEEYDAGKINQYVEKKPVIVSGKSLQAFMPRRFRTDVERYRRDPQNLVFDDDILVRFGQPRKLTEDLFALVAPESAENIFLLANNKESTCGMSVLLSTIRSFLAQKGHIQIWAHPRNRIYHWYKSSHLYKQQIFEGADEVRDAIDQLREKVQKRQEGNELIILLGMENICGDLTPQAMGGFSISANPATQINLDAVMAKTPEQLAESEACYDDIAELSELQDRFYEEGEALGKTEEQLDAEFEVVMAEFLHKKHGVPTSEKTVSPIQSAVPVQTAYPSKQPHHSRDYQKDFQELIRIGSRLGYHFMVCINNYQALQGMGLSLKLFNHRVSFKTDSADTSMYIFNNSSAFRLPEHTCYYAAFGSSEGSYAVTPYLHKGVTWDNWIVDEDGIARDKNRL